MRARAAWVIGTIAGVALLASILRQLRLRRRRQRRRDGAWRGAAAADDQALDLPPPGVPAGGRKRTSRVARERDSEGHSGALGWLGSLWRPAAAALLGDAISGSEARQDGIPLKSPRFGSAVQWQEGAAKERAAAPPFLGMSRKARARTSPALGGVPGGGKGEASNLRRGGLTAQQAKVHASERAAAAAAASNLPHEDGLTSAAALRARRPHEKRARIYFGLDIGGSLAKIVHFEPQKKSKASLRRLASFIRASSTYQTGVRDVHLQLGALSGTLHFIRFETRRMAAFLQLVRQERLHAEATTIYATGGGAHKFAADFESELGVKLEKLDELACCVKGVTWLLDQVPDELFEYRETTKHAQHEHEAGEEGSSRAAAAGSGDEADYEHTTGEAMEAVPYRIPPGGTYPFILVNIGSGVSILRIRSEDDFERISGTAVGGGTFLGLCRLLGCGDSFDEALENAATGDDAKVNLLVEDIYGGSGYDAFGLPPKLIASMFAKVLRRDDPYEGVEKSDVCRALLVMISQVIAQVAYLSATNSGVGRLVFSGTFLHSNQIALRTLAYYVARWSNGSMPALFLKHEGYSGALGAFLFSARLEEAYGVSGGFSSDDGDEDDANEGGGADENEGQDSGERDGAASADRSAPDGIVRPRSGASVGSTGAARPVSNLGRCSSAELGQAPAASGNSAGASVNDGKAAAPSALTRGRSVTSGSVQSASSSQWDDEWR